MPLKIKGLTSGSVVIKAPDTGAEDVEYDIANDFATPTSVSAVDTRVNAVGGRKNLIINGAMQVSQRGDFTTDSSASSATFYLDRFKTGLSVVTANKQHKLNQSVDGTLKNTLTCTVTGAGTGYVYQYERLEVDDIRKYDGKTMTASCWIRSNNNDFGLILYDNNTWYKGSTNTSSGAWQKITYTFTCNIGSTSTFALGISNFGSGASGSALAVNDYFEFTELQLELGSVATDFEHRSYGEELALCQRYYELCETGMYGAFVTTSDYRNSYSYKQRKRTSPTLTKISQAENCCSSCTVTTGALDTLTSGRGIGTNVFVTSSAGKYWYVSFSADAEL
jgi:hypothetical protein